MNLPTLKDNQYCLEGGEGFQRKYPNSFFIPSLKKRNNIVTGNYVMLIFKMTVIDDEIDYSIERMWVLVKERVKDFYLGTLNNDPCCLVHIKCGDDVVFKADHIIKITDGK